jgi:hypothetical protein
MKARELAIAGLLAALQILTLLLAYVIPTIKIALLFAASAYPGVLLRIGVKKRAVLVSYLSAAVLTVFLIQIPEIQAGFAVFFGWYGLLHEATKPMKPAIKQAVRWAGFLAAAALMYASVLYFVDIEFKYALWAMALLGAAAFVIMQFIYEFTVREFIKISKIGYLDGKITFKR